MGKKRTFAVTKTVTKTTLKAEKSDVAYWRSQPYASRIQALETIRREFHQWKYNAEPRFQRVYKIQNLKPNKKASGRLQDLADLENLGE